MLSKEEKRAIDFFKKSFNKKIPPFWYDDTISNIEEKIKTILNHIEKQQADIKKKDNIIDKMAEEIYNLSQKQDMRNDNITIWINKEHILNYFTKKE